MCSFVLFAHVQYGIHYVTCTVCVYMHMSYACAGGTQRETPVYLLTTRAGVPRVISPTRFTRVNQRLIRLPPRVFSEDTV